MIAIHRLYNKCESQKLYCLLSRYTTSSCICRFTTLFSWLVVLLQKETFMTWITSWIHPGSHLFLKLSCRVNFGHLEARLPLHDGQHRTWQMCHCSLNVKSTLIKVALPQHKPGSPWGKLVATYNFAASPFLHYMISTQDHFNPASWWLPQSCDPYSASFCCRDVGPNGPNNKHGLEEHLWHVGSATSTVDLSWKL